jgi:hypothetical protein
VASLSLAREPKRRHYCNFLQSEASINPNPENQISHQCVRSKIEARNSKIGAIISREDLVIIASGIRRLTRADTKETLKIQNRHLTF